MRADYNSHACCNNGSTYDDQSEVIALSEGMSNYDYNSGDYDHYRFVNNTTTAALLLK